MGQDRQAMKRKVARPWHDRPDFSSPVRRAFANVPPRRMIIHQLIYSFLKAKGGSPEFFNLQARDAIGWMRRQGVKFASATTVLDIGCGFGDVGGEVARTGAQVTLSDDDSFVSPDYQHLPFRKFNLDRDDFATLGQYDVVICSNVLEHLPRPDRLLAAIPLLLKPDGRFYLSWTNWHSPWGGHEFSPFHYLGFHRGVRIWERVTKRQRQHNPGENLYYTTIGRTLRTLRANPALRIATMAPRYYPEFACLVHLPIVREFLTWNCAMLLARSEDAPR